MKTIYLILFITTFSIFSSSVYSQCDQLTVYYCATKTGGAIYLRDFNTRLVHKRSAQKTGRKWEVFLNKGIHYRLTVCTENNYKENVELRLYKEKSEEFTEPVGVSGLTDFGAYGFDFVCNESGKYFVSLRFKQCDKTEKTCAVGILSFIPEKKK